MLKLNAQMLSAVKEQRVLILTVVRPTWFPKTDHPLSIAKTSPVKLSNAATSNQFLALLTFALLPTPFSKIPHHNHARTNCAHLIFAVTLPVRMPLSVDFVVKDPSKILRLESVALQELA